MNEKIHDRKIIRQIFDLYVQRKPRHLICPEFKNKVRLDSHLPKQKNQVKFFVTRYLWAPVSLVPSQISSLNFIGIV